MKIILTALTFLALMSACNYKVSKTTSAQNGGPIARNATAVSSFRQLKSQIFESKCFTCHNGTRHSDLAPYASFKSSLGEIRERLVSGGSDHMPKAGSPQLSADELNSVLAWIDAGAPEDETSTPSPVASPTPQPTPANGAMGYEQLREYVLKAKCITCHIGTDPVGDSDDLSMYPGAFAFKGSIKKRILAPPESPLHMPPNDRPQLTSDEQSAIVKWVEAGGPK